MIKLKIEEFFHSGGNVTYQLEITGLKTVSEQAVYTSCKYTLSHWNQMIQKSK